MSIEIKVPALPESVADATILAWQKKPGDAVRRDEVLVEVETDKVVLEVPAPVDGVLATIVAEEGATVVAQQTLGTLTEGAAASAGAAPAASAPAATANSAESLQIVAPVLPESVADATVLDWRKAPGDAIARDEVLVELETDKVVLEVPSPGAGVLAEINAATGDTVVAGALLGTVTAGAGAAAPAAVPSAGVESAATGGATSPSVRNLMAEHGLQASQIAGSGRDGRILKSDVEAYLEGSGGASAGGAPAAVAPAPAPAAAPGAVAANEPAAMPVGDRTERRVPMTRLRARIAERLLEASQSTAMLTTFNEVNMQPIKDLRSTYKDQFEKAHGVRLGFMSVFVKAATEALKRFPDINASIDGDDIVYHGFCDIGIAVSSSRGLVVPVLRDAEHMSLADIEQQIGDYAGKAKEGKLGIEDLTGGTFTITNGGVFGSLMSTPILNPPQSAILGMHSMQDRPVAENGQVVIRPMMYIALSYDHRIVDGQGAVTFLKTIKELVEEPAKILLDI